MAGLSIFFICQTVDEDDTVLPHLAGWLRALGEHPAIEMVSAVSLRAGRRQLGERVALEVIGGGGKLATLWRFYRAVLRSIRRPRVDLFFVCQGGPYPLLLLPFRLLFGVPIVQWKAHARVSRRMRFFARWCDDVVLTATPSSFPLPLPNVRVVGHAIDTTRFRPVEREPEAHIVSVGRIAPVKGCERMIELLAHCRERYATAYRLTLYGPVLPENRKYRDELLALARRLDVERCIELRGAVLHEELPELLRQYRLFLNCSSGALDKACLEAMACGVPVVSTNPCVAEAAPDWCRPHVFSASGTLEDLGARVHALLSDPPLSERLGLAAAELVRREHGLETFWSRVLAELPESLRERCG